MLYLYSEDDRLIPAAAVEKTIRAAAFGRGAHVTSRRWPHSPHVQHLRTDPEGYAAELERLVHGSALHQREFTFRKAILLMRQELRRGPGTLLDPLPTYMYTRPESDYDDEVSSSLSAHFDTAQRVSNGGRCVLEENPLCVEL